MPVLDANDKLNMFNPPSFGGLARPDHYYATVSRIFKTLRNTASQATMAQHMNSIGIRTPRGKPWSKATVSNYLRKTSLN